jgi:hypothetical protein
VAGLPIQPGQPHFLQSNAWQGSDGRVTSDIPFICYRLSLKIPPESLQSLVSFVRRQPIVMDAQRVFPQTVSVTLLKDLSIGAKNTSPRSRSLVILPQRLYPSLADVWLLLLHGSCISAVSDFVVENE